jgi:hypothetical protein
MSEKGFEIYQSFEKERKDRVLRRLASLSDDARIALLTQALLVKREKTRIVWKRTKCNSVKVG